MKPTFHIKRLGAQDRSITYDAFLTKSILDDISFRLTSGFDYDIDWIEERNQGRLITLETDCKIEYINLSQIGEVRGRNYLLQSIPTAFSIYMKEKRENSKKSNFCFYFLPLMGNYETDYLSFFYRIMLTAGITFLNADTELKRTSLVKYNAVKDIIIARDISRNCNIANQSTYITDEGESYHIYGKTFGANQKETTLLCLAIANITDKPIKLFQINDNDSDSISEQDVFAIETFVKENCKYSLKILDSSFPFDNDKSDKEPDALRSPKFVYNLLCKFGGSKKCILCNCKIDSIVQAAHIYPIASIRRRTDLSSDLKFKWAIDEDNGIWLCENHHKLFDRELIGFDNGKLTISPSLTGEDLVFVKQVTTVSAISPKYINSKMLAFFDNRKGIHTKISI